MSIIFLIEWFKIYRLASIYTQKNLAAAQNEMKVAMAM
jgi:hypothetical protein